MRLSEAFDMYLEDYIRAKNQSTRTEESHEACKRLLVQFLGDKELSQLSLLDVREWRKEISKGRRPNSVRVYILRLRAVLRYCNIRDIPAIKSELVPVPKREATVPVFLTEQEVTRMIECSTSVRNAFIDQRTELLMNMYLASRKDNHEALIVSNEYKRRMTATNIQLLVRNSASKACLNKKVSPHTLRHSFATNFLKNNGNMRYLSAMLGHASLDTTMMYAHVVDLDLQNQYEKYNTI